MSLKTVIISKRDRKIRSLLDQAQSENIIVRSPEGREFILAEIDDFDREIELSRQDEKLMAFLDRRAQQRKVLSLEEAKQSLQ